MTVDPRKRAEARFDATGPVPYAEPVTQGQLWALIDRAARGDAVSPDAQRLTKQAAAAEKLAARRAIIADLFIAHGDKCACDRCLSVRAELDGYLMRKLGY